ncbi:MAG: NAD-dependent epimerase/dehydratase family protein [Actinobacteria bacterium]|nr:NAD-dependent epimerase/dehydratase family protein [Actinomycetota bacterium]
MDQALVTGGTGYVGRELVRQLLQRQDQVTVLSRSRPTEKTRWLQADITDRKGLQTALKDCRFDVIYHLASLPGDTGDPEEMMRVNVQGLMYLLECARQTTIRRFVLASSISAYEWYPETKFNPPDYMPVDENHPCRPRNIYASTKRMQELLALTYCHQFQVPITILRLTAVMGPFGRGGGKMWRDFAEQMNQGKRIQLPMLSPEEIGHFVDVRDVAEMHIVAGENPRARGEIFNCCGPKPIRGSEFASEVKRIIPGAEVAFGYPWSMAQGGRIEFDMSKMKKLLGYEPRYGLRDSLLAIHEWVRNSGSQ